MSSPASPASNPDSDPTAVAKQVIADLSRLSRTSTAPEAFYLRTADLLAQATDALAAFVWIVTPDNASLIAASPQRSREDRTRLESTGKQTVPRFSPDSQERHGFVAPNDPRLKATRRPVTEAADHPDIHRAEYLLTQSGDRQIILEWVTDQAWPTERSIIPSLIVAIREIAADFHRNLELFHLREARGADQRLVAAAQRLLAIHDAATLDCEIVNSAVEALQADRASLVRMQADSTEVIAISGVSSLNRHAEAVTDIGQRARQAENTGLPFITPLSDHSSDPQPTPSYVALPLDDPAQEDSGAFGPGVETSKARDATILVLDWIDQPRPDTPAFRELLQRYAELAGLAWRQSLVTGRRRQVRPSQRHRRTTIIFAGLALAMLALWLIPARLKVRASGQIIPEIERGIFAPLPGEIVEVKAHHNKQVRRGEVLLTLHSPDLELQLSELWGEHQATQEKIRAIEARYARGPTSEPTEPTPDPVTQASQLQELRILQASQLESLAILRKQKEALTVRSPIDGQIVTWQLDKLLAGRPVQRGQLLLSVADTTGPWLAELEIRDDRIGHVLNQTTADRLPPATCMLISSPTARYSGNLVSLAATTRENIEGLPVVQATARFDFSKWSEPRSGAKIIASIDCGNHPLGYVWFHEFYEFAANLLF